MFCVSKVTKFGGVMDYPVINLSLIVDVNGCRIQLDSEKHITTSRRNSTGSRVQITAMFNLCKNYLQTIIYNYNLHNNLQTIYKSPY